MNIPVKHILRHFTFDEIKLGILPEGRIPLADAVIDLCLAPKSNSGIKAIDAALADVESGQAGQIPDDLRDAHYRGAKQLGHGQGYKLPHNYPNGWVAQQYLPDNLKNKQYYQPKTTGRYEAALAQRQQQLKSWQHEAKIGRASCRERV